jgi:hypothetical protein
MKDSRYSWRHNPEHHLNLRKEHSFGMLENRVLRTIFERMGEEATEDWRKQYNKEL